MRWRPRTAPLFEPRVLHDVARAAVGLPNDKMVRQVSDELEIHDFARTIGVYGRLVVRELRQGKL